MTLKEVSNNIRAKNKLFEQVCSACTSLLRGNHPVSKTAQKYLDSRLSKESQERYQFGYFPSNKHFDMISNIIDVDILEQLSLVYPRYVKEGIKRDTSILDNHNLVMPYKDLYGNIIALVGRSLLSDEERKEKNISKYKNSPFSKSLNIFGLDKAKRSIIKNDHVIIVEGQFDCITAAEFKFDNVVAIGGVALSKYQIGLLTRYTNNIYLALDNDEAGSSTTNKIIKRYNKIAKVRAVSYPNCYKDIDEYLRLHNDHNAIYNIS